MAITRDQIQEYFERYLFDHLPYRDDELYGIILRYLLDVYIDQIYNQVPGDFKLLVEDKEVPESLIDHMLLSAGMPQELLNQLSYSDKAIILKCYGDLARIKGSVNLLYRIARDLNEPIGIYELLITKKDDWSFVAKKIYEHESITPSRDGNVIAYDDIYQRVPEYLVDKNTLNTLHSNGQLVLPLQSHIILFVTQNVQVSTIVDLIFIMYYTLFRNTIFLFELEGYSPVNINLSDLVLAVWYLNTARSGLNYYIDNRIGYIANATTFDTLGWNTEDKFQELINDYNALKFITDLEEKRRLLDNFTDKWLAPLYSTINETNISKDDIFSWLTISNSRFANILKDIIDNNPDRIDETLEQLYISFLGSRNPSSSVYDKYKYLFVSLLFSKVIQPDKMTTYAFYYQMKPYHVMLTTDVASFADVVINDPYDTTCLSSRLDVNCLTQYLSTLFQIDDMQLYVVERCCEFLELASVVKPSIISGPKSKLVLDYELDLESGTRQISSVLTLDKLGKQKLYTQRQELLMVSSIPRFRAGLITSDNIPFKYVTKLVGNLMNASTVTFLTSRVDRIYNRSYDLLFLASWVSVKLS